MGKKARIRAQRDRRSVRHIQVLDAAQVVAMTEHLVAAGEHRGAPLPARKVGAVAGNIHQVWRREQVVLRADREFVNALLDSNTDVQLAPEWLDRQPFDALAVSLSEPLSLNDGNTLCHYVGFAACGIRHRASAVSSRSDRYQNIWTTYWPLNGADGIRFLWLYQEDGDPTTRGQTVTCPLRGQYAAGDETLTELIQRQQAGAEAFGHPWGQELATLVPLAFQLLLYLTAQEPDLDWVPAEQMRRPSQLRTARVANLGWRVGSTLRTWRQHPPANTAGSAQDGASSERTLPPHIRRAHWHRVRIATRDNQGRIVGTTSGTHGVDWAYQMRWYPPTLVNTDQAPPPTVRGVDPDKPGT
ncbi:MAG TPA: hypothetical protein VGN37_23720 [Actinocatenispora sp.]